MKHLILSMVFFSSINCWGWWHLTSDANTMRANCEKLPAQIPENIVAEVMLKMLTSKDIGYSDCKIIKPESEMFLIPCYKPEYKMFIGVKTYALCIKKAQINYLLSINNQYRR